MKLKNKLPQWCTLFGRCSKICSETCSNVNYRVLFAVYRQIWEEWMFDKQDLFVFIRGCATVRCKKWLCWVKRDKKIVCRNLFVAVVPSCCFLSGISLRLFTIHYRFPFWNLLTKEKSLGKFAVSKAFYGG